MSLSHICLLVTRIAFSFNESLCNLLEEIYDNNISKTKNYSQLLIVLACCCFVFVFGVLAFV